jgi:hypothetical protein
MEQISKEDIRELKKARSYLIQEANPTFRQHTKYSDLFLEKSKQYGVGLQQLHDHIASL